MRIPFSKPAFFAAVFVVMSAVSGCSSTSEVVEPKMSPIESQFQVQKKWAVSQGLMNKHDAQALRFAFDEQALYFATNNGRLSALSLQTKSRWQDQLVWQTAFNEGLISGPVLEGKQLIVGTDEGRVKVIDSVTGRIIWQTQLSSEVLSAATVAQNKVFVRTSDGRIYALNRKDGAVVWVSEHQMPNLSLRGAPRVIANDEYVFVAWESGILQALQIQSGALAWESRVAIPSGRTDLERMVDIQANMVLRGDTLYALGYNGKFVAINVTSGNFLYVKELSGYRDFIVGDQVIYLVDNEDIIYALDRYSGTQIWKQTSMKGRLINDLQRYGDNLIVADGWGYLHWFNAVQGNEYARIKHSNQYGEGNRISTLKVQDNALYVLDETGTVSHYQVKTSDFIEFRKSFTAASSQD